jgi:hypothetical protein
MSATVNATVAGDRLTGTISVMGLSFTIEAQRTPDSVATQARRH